MRSFCFWPIASINSPVVSPWPINQARWWWPYVRRAPRFSHSGFRAPEISGKGFTLQPYNLRHNLLWHTTERYYKKGRRSGNHR